MTDIAIKILIVDDEMDIRRVFEDYLKNLDFLSGQVGIDEAADGIEALKYLENTRYDLIFTDLMMPKMNGIDLIKRIRLEPGDNTKTPIICMSGFMQQVDTNLPDEIIEDVLFLEKPIDTERVKRFLQVMLEEKKP